MKQFIKQISFFQAPSLTQQIVKSCLHSTRQCRNSTTNFYEFKNFRKFTNFYEF